MSLHEAADGILGTHVSWGDVEKEMQKALGTTATFGEEKTATNISDLKGFMSKIALIDAHWVGGSDEEDLPERFIVKISSQLPMIEMTKLMDIDGGDMWTEERTAAMGNLTRMLHNREVEVYKILTKEKHPNIPFTKIYALKSFDEENKLKAYIISEYVPNTHHIGMHDSIPADDLLPIVRAVAAFSAIGQKLSEEETKFARGVDFIDIIFGQFFDEKNMEKSDKLLLDAFPEEYHEKVQEMFKINKDYYANMKMMPNIKKTCEFFGYKPVFTHSDLWSSNFLCTKEGDKVTLKAIIDYQTVSFATPAQDVGRLFASCLSTKDRREKADFLMEEYYKTFVHELGGYPVPYTLQQLKDSYQVYYPMMTLMVLPGIAPILKHTDLPEEEKAVMEKKALDKMVGLLEDVLSTHKSSMDKFPKYFEF